MSDLLWDDVMPWFDPVENRSAPDVIVADTTPGRLADRSGPDPLAGMGKRVRVR
ncbi:hypothetical protein [Actinoplanes sp. NPDC051411]|uniref:hypothetical protein n=1 Tax=Actinoplanes sp. NPDC051411 TaxID=3155522 RepID=UPI003422486E